MRVRLLGRVEVRGDQGRPVVVAGARRRAVLALLASELNRPVPVERLLDTVWDGAPPRPHGRPSRATSPPSGADWATA